MAAAVADDDEDLLAAGGIRWSSQMSHGVDGSRSGSRSPLPLEANLDIDFDMNFPALLGREPLANALPSSAVVCPLPETWRRPDSEEVISLAAIFAKIEAIERDQDAVLLNFEQSDKSSSMRSSKDSPARRSSNASCRKSRTSIHWHGALVTTRTRMWRFLEDRASSRLARWYSHLVSVFIFGGVVNFWAELFDICKFSASLAMFEQVFFAVELVVRFVVCPARSAFVCDLHNWVDVATTLMPVPVIVMPVGQEVMGGLRPEFFQVFCPILMMLKLLRRFQTFHLLETAIRDASQALPLLLYTLFVIGSFFAAVIYIVEPRSNISSLGHAAWLVIVTMGTVGYGDVTATTTAGYIASSVMIVVASMYMALPIGIVGSSFSTVWKDRHNLMTLQKVRCYVSWAGIGVNDMAHFWQCIFESVDDDGDARLTFDEFKDLLPLLDVDVSEFAALRLFQHIDHKAEGFIEYGTFLDAVFPGSHVFTTFYRRRRKQRQQCRTETPKSASPRTRFMHGGLRSQGA